MEENQIYNQNMPENSEAQTKSRAAEGLAKASMVLGILSIAGAFCCMPFVFSGIGITLAILSKGASSYYSRHARTGLICSIIGLVTSFVLTVFIIVVEIVMLFSMAGSDGDFWQKIRSQYEQQYEEMYGQELPEEVEDLFDGLEEGFQNEF
ncbi:MAG: hypothetical protein QM697_10270 [Lachnospiraceae bacterium]